MKKNLAIIALTAGILLAVVFLTFHLHQTSKEKVLSQFNEHQLLIARQVAIQIESYFRARSNDVRWLSSFPSLRYRDKKKMPAVIQTNFKRLKAIHIKEISVLDEKGTVVYSTAGDAIGSNYARSDIYAWAKKPVNKGMVRLAREKADRQGIPATGEGLKPPSPRISLVTPLYQESAAGAYPGPGGKFAGILSLTVDLEKMLAERTLLFTPAMKLHTLWIMDKDGTLLLQS
ncbi:MAG: cache domain-containing protein, partial [Thermodesulfobacteriota bacterium]